MDDCIACGCPNIRRKQETSDSRQEIFHLHPNQKLGVKLLPPKSGFIERGISVDKVANPELLHRIQRGDIITNIGGMALDGTGFSTAVNYIRTLPRPLEFVFDVDEIRRQDERVVGGTGGPHGGEEVTGWERELTSYAVVFDDGPMGLNLEEATRYGIDGAVVKALKGQASENGQISVGDIVAKVNDQDVLFRPYVDIMNAIRKTKSPRTIHFVPKEKLMDVQHLGQNQYSRQSMVFAGEAFLDGDGGPSRESKFYASSRLVRTTMEDDLEDDVEEKVSLSPSSSPHVKHSSAKSSKIANLILANQHATIKKGRMFKQGRVVKNWKSRYFVLSVSKLEYFKSPSATSSRGELLFINQRCTVRDLVPAKELVCKNPEVMASYLIDIRVGDRKLVIACTSEKDKKGWMDALKLATDAAKTLSKSTSEATTTTTKQHMRNRKTSSSSRGGYGKSPKTNENPPEEEEKQPPPPRLHFPPPMIQITVLSASNLTKRGSVLNACCEVSLKDEIFRSSVVKSSRNPVWTSDHAVAFNVSSEDDVIEIRLFDERTFRGADLVSTLTVPIASLPNMQKTIKKYPLVTSAKTSGAQLTLALEYVDKAKQFQTQRERARLNDDLARASVMMEREEMLAIQSEAQAAADEASAVAQFAEAQASSLLEEARVKARAAVEAAQAEAAQGKAAVEAAMAEAAMAKAEAEHQAAEAEAAKAEALALVRENQDVQARTNAELRGQALTEKFLIYRQALFENKTHDEVKDQMRKDGVEEANVVAFFEGMASYDAKIAELQAQVAKLSKTKAPGLSLTNRQPPPPAPAVAMQQNVMTFPEGISTDQEKLLRRLLKLEKQLQQAGITIAEDIPYEEAKAQVQAISMRMQEIGSSDVTHDDLEVQTSMREEYYKLEQDMEKYNTALMLSDEYAQDEQRKAREWEDYNASTNAAALEKIRRSMPITISSMSEAELEATVTPNGLKMSRDVARKFKRANVLQLLRTDPQVILRMHPSLLENLRVTGLNVSERRALHVHLRDIAQTWQTQQQDEMSGRKWVFFKTLRETFKSVVNAYNRHVEEYGPVGNHPYLERGMNVLECEQGCPLVGKQCPLKADAVPCYVDLGYPAEAQYQASNVQKSDAEDAGAKALREAKELARVKLSNGRTDLLKKHYGRGKVREVAKASGACDELETVLETLERRLGEWWLMRKSASRPTPASIRTEMTHFSEFLKSCRLTCLTLAERAGIQLSGKRNEAQESLDERAPVEIHLCAQVLEAFAETLEDIEKRMYKLDKKERGMEKAMPVLKALMQDIHNKNQDTLERLVATKPPKYLRKRKTLAEIAKEVTTKLAREKAAAAETSEPSSESPHSSLSSGRGGRGGLLGSIRGRGGGGGLAAGGLLGAIRGRGRGRGGANPMAGGRGGLMAAIAQRKKKDES